MANPIQGAGESAALSPAAPPGISFKTVLQELIRRNGSDLHLKVGRPPTIRIDGELEPLEHQPLRPEDLKALAEQLMTPRQVKQFAEEKECDFAIGVPGIGRFRVNVYQQRGSLCYAMRAIPYQARTISELNLPPVLEEVALKPRGLILVTGVTGSGKSTALAAMIQHINENRRANVITIEDPIEFLHRDINSHINQREIGTDTATFGQALRRVLRQDPDVILIGELRDAETAQTALQAAESGHLVLSTLHTIDAAETVGRMIEFFPPEKQEVIRSVMAGVLRGVISQRLLPKEDGGRVAAVEVMVMNARIADLIREGRSEDIIDAVAEGEFFQMQTFTQALIEHVLAGTVDREIAANAATNRHDFLVALEQAIKRKRANDNAAAAEAVKQSDVAAAQPQQTPPTQQPDGGLGLRVAPAG
jgi:twitching motility protein PilT